MGNEILHCMVGVDEVGRGSLAGPLLVVAATQTSVLPKGLTDSKLLSRAQRVALYSSLRQSCIFGEGWVSPSEIDNLGLARALRLGVKRALRCLSITDYEEIIMDGNVNYIPRKVKGTFLNGRAQIGADLDVPVVSAASVYAKVTRDQYMYKLADNYSDYGFDSHVGYGTQRHRKAIREYGPIKGLHRMSFYPLRKAAVIK